MAHTPSDDRPTAASFALGESVVHLGGDGSATAIACDDDFWQNMPACFEQGRMVSLFRSEADWDKWEMHPEGDEIICLLSGAMTLILDRDGAPAQEIRLDAGRTVIVPKGVWHTADVGVAGDALYITPGADTQSRPRV